uniref:Auxin transport protein BIG n=1 Tax=Salix viminalis TaxID=40686 RepID=A0A6N2MZV9_SALVM
MAVLMELALVDGVDKVTNTLQSCSENSILELPMVSGDCRGMELDDHIKCSLQEGVGCSIGEKPVDRLLMKLKSECLQPEWQASGISGHGQDLNNLIFLSQHWAVVHVDCVRRLMSCCHKLIELPDIPGEKIAGPDFCNGLSFGLRILKLLRNLIKHIPYIEYDASMLQEAASCAEAFPKLFRLQLDFVNNHTAVDGNLESLILSLLEEFLHVVQVIFCNTSALQNIQACVVASILDNLDSSIWRDDKSSTTTKPPLVYFPRTVLYVINLVQDIKRQAHQALDLNEFDTDVVGSSAEFLHDCPSCLAHFERVPLLKRFTAEELLRIIFSPSTQWMDNLMYLVSFLHSEGVKLRPKVERSHSSCSKANCSIEVENVVCHEDEALFGNLFSEGGRSVGSVDGYEQPVVAINSFSSNCNMPMQAATETLSFLKDSVFFHAWSPSIFEDGCKRLQENHIDTLLSILYCQGCRFLEDNSSDSCANLHEQRKTRHIHELCFELLRNLLTHHSLSDSLEEYLVEQILKVENDAFAYNDQTLTLLAHTLFSRELIGSLPSVFHVEILLMAFHLSSTGEKAAHANLIFSSLRAVDAPSVGFSSTQLSCWALLVSRLISLLHHMMFYPRNCPSSFLLDLRSKLREAPICGSLLPTRVNDQLLSWVSIAMKNILGACAEEEPSVNTLINQMVDISALPPSLCRDELAIESLCLSWNDIYATFSWVLGFWKGKRASSVEDLIIERYIFSLCSDIPAMSSAADDQLSLGSEPLAHDMSNMTYFFCFIRSLLGHCNDIGKGSNLPDDIIGILHEICALNIPEEIKELGWDFLRTGSWLSLVLSLLNVGLCRYCMKIKVPGVAPFWIENTASDNQFVAVAEGLTSCLIEAGQVSMLVRMLSTLLNRYLQAYQKAFLAIIDNDQHDVKSFPSLLLLKHSSFDKCLQDEVFKNGTSFCNLDYVFDLLSKLDVVADKRAPGIQCKVFWECMLHGFPSHLRTTSAVFLSCTLRIKGIVFLLDKLFRVENLREKVSLETEVMRQIIDSVMTIKFDRIFESLQGKCEDIVRNLGTGSELSDYTDLFLMKHMEGFLREIHGRGVSDSSIYEWIITKIINTADSLRKDPIKSVIFKFYLGAEDMPEMLKDFCGLQCGDLLVLIDSLDDCCSESVNGKVLSFFVDILSGDFCPDLKQKIRKKFFGMDLNDLSKWLEKRLLGCVVELQRVATREYSMKLLLKKTTMLIKKLAGDEHLFPGLKFLFGFLGSLLSDFGSTKSSLEKTLGKPVLGGSLGAGSVAFKRSDQERILTLWRILSLECDANSVDDDDDDGTSDVSGSNFMEQHWYFCYTCDLTGSKGCCSVCAKVCHRGHRVVYSRSSRFFCDCGAGGVRGSSCQCLKARKFTGSDSAPIRNTSNFQSFLPFTADADQLPESDSELDEDAAIDADNSLRLSIPKELQDRMPMLLEELDVEGQLKKAYKSGSLDLKIKADYSNAKDLRSHLTSGSLFKSLLSVNNRGRLAVGEGYEDCHVLTLNPRGEVTDRLAIELALQGAYIRRVDWVPGSQGRMFLIVLSEQGSLFRLQLSVEGNVGATPLKEIIAIQDRDINAKGSSLYFSSTYKLLMLSYQDGTTLMGRLSPDATSLTEISFVYEDEQDGRKRPAGLHRWKELLVGSGLFVCFSSMKSNAALAVSLGLHELHSQNMRHTVGATSLLVGLTAYKPLSKDKVHCLILHDDGSLQIYSHVPAGADTTASVTAEKVKKNGDAEAAKHTLASEDGFLESPSPAGFKISVSNSNPDIVMVGFRVNVGIHQQRAIKLDEGMRSWYDIPFTVAESLLADEEFMISVGPTSMALHFLELTRLKYMAEPKMSLDGRRKWMQCWTWKLVCLAPFIACRSTSVQEQAVSDGLKLLSRLYSLRRSQEDEVKLDLSELKCKLLLETIFESDREPMLQAAACCVLQAVFPKKERYYQVKDAMRLHGVVKSTSALSSRLGVGGNTGGWIIEEFTAQMRAVSKIALHRRSNLALFLEMNGSEVVDGLMQVLWGILDLEQPDTQTLNNIVISSVELIYCYAECLTLHGKDSTGRSVAPAVLLFKKLLLAISSRLLQVPFPKQTMLATDDVVDSMVSASGQAETVGGNAQVMIEEDSITSSVQYCCDGCSTVPILRRRWHCTVCPDFDLCENCYQVLDADRLPPPHSRDHPMTAIPIEMESLGGDGNEIHFSTDDASDLSLLPASTDVSKQNTTPSIHILEPNESGDFSASLKGWMETTSGVRAIPIMQLFYRLSSAAGGPFVNSSRPETLDFEKLIRWFLDEIDLNKPFVARTRSSFGEVAILVFMFFTLMLRNWHQPGSDVSVPKSSGNTDTHDKNIMQVASVASQYTLDGQEKNDFASQLLQACSSLRNQNFVNYLMDSAALVHIFKSSTASFEATHGVSTSSGCGALLTVRRDLPAGNFSPFFSDSYAKAHRSDIFIDYHRLLLENAFRLVYTLVRPEKQDKTGEKEKVYKISSAKDLKLDGYQDVLCSYINNPHTAFVRRYARRLFLHLCGSKTHYYSVRDSWQFSSEVKKLYKHINKSGGLQSHSYERSVKIVKCLSTMAEVSAARPRNWQKYCLKHGDVLSFLMNGVFFFGEEFVIQTLKLLNLAFYSGKDMSHSTQKPESGDSGTSTNKSVAQALDSKKKKKGEDGTESGLEKSYLDMEAVVDIFADKGGDVLGQFVDCFLLEWNSSSVRTEAKSVLYGAWHHGKQPFKEAMLMALLQKVKNMPMYGQNIVEFTELVTWLLGKAPDNSLKQLSTGLIDRCLTPDVIRCIFETLHSQNELIANHPNSRIYNTLSGLVEFDGYYLESEPCVACSSPEVPYSRMKLESLKSEMKFTDNRIIVKCTGSYTIQTVTMNVHDARKSKSVKTELKVEFPIPITACNFMIELDSFYENLQALSLEPLQCPRCSRPVTDKHGICGNCHENAYQCRQCRNINYENLDSFLCNECGYSKYGRFEFNFMAKPSFTFDSMENDEDMKRGLAAIELESENAHRRYQQLLGFKKPLLKIVSSIGENEMDSQQKDSVQQMMVSLPGPSCKINRKIALLGVLYGEKCKAAFDSVSKSVQTLQGLRQVLMSYLHQKLSDGAVATSRFVISRSPNNCYGCATTFVTQCLEILQVLSKHLNLKKQLVTAGILPELFENNIHQGPKAARVQARAVLCAFSEGDINAKKVMYCLEHHRSMDIALATREELLLLSEVCSLADEFWESRLRVVFQLLFSSIKLGAKHPAIAEHIILPCLRIISQACTPPKPDTVDKEQGTGKSVSAAQLKDENNSSGFGSLSGFVSGNKSAAEHTGKNWDASNKTRDIQLLSYSEWEKGASYLDFVRRQYKVSQAVKGLGQRSRSQRNEYLVLKYGLRWKRRASKTSKGGLFAFELGSWVTELVLSACSQSIRSEMCMLINLLCAQSSSRRFRLLNLLMALLPATLAAGESAAEYFELLFKMVASEDARLFLTVRGCLTSICKLITQEVGNVESLERSLHIDISQGFILHKLIELLGKFLEVPNIRSSFMRDNLLSDVLEALIVTRGLIVQKTKLISDCNRLLKDLLDSLLLESSENKRQFIRACICGLQIHGEERKGRACLFILEQLCNLICPSKPESLNLLVLNKAHTQEEFIRGSMTKNPYSSAEVGPLMRDVKNKICNQLDLLALAEDDFAMELLVAGNIISLDLSIAQVYEQVWKKSNIQSSNAAANSTLLSASSVTSARDCPPMTVTYRLQGLDGEATEPMIKELEEDREESQDPEVEFAIAGAVRDCGGLEILLGMIQRLRDDFKSNQEQLVAVLNLLMHCCKIRENRRALLRLGALGLLLETARCAFSVDAMEPAEGILLIVESLTLEANESDNINIAQSALTVSSEETGTGEQAKKIVVMFLERLCHPSGLKKSNKQQRNTEMVARILPYLTYGEPAAMEALIQHFNPNLQDWRGFDQLQKQHQENPKDENITQKASKQRFTVENFVRVSESLKTSSCGERLKDIILEKGIIDVALLGRAGFKSSAEWSLGLKLPSVPHILSMLRGLSMGHLATQRSIDEGGILPLLHALEGVSGENEIGARAENLLDTLSNKEGKGDGFLEEKVCKLRHATRDEMRRRALRKREELLQGLGMRQELASDGGERIVVARPILEGLEDVEEEEDGLACMVCREGYSLRPTDLLGVYCFSKLVNLGVGSSGSARGECVYTTEAKRADAALKNPKKEWEGATLRNNESLCNSLFPVNGPCVPLPQYIRYVDQYWDNLNALGRADGSRLRLLTYDIVLMLARFATGASFSVDCRGGGRESNSRFLPFMIQMARHLLEQGSPSQRRSMGKAVSSYIASSSSLDFKTPAAQPATGTEETVQFMMVNSLLSESYESWLQHRRSFLQRGIYHAYMQHTHGRPSSRASPTSSSMVRIESGSPSGSPATGGADELFSIVRNMLVYTGVIEQLQRFFKVKRSSNVPPTGAEGTLTGSEGEDEGSLEGWEIMMKERLLNVREMVGFSKELLSWLDEINSATDLQEAFDIIGVLADVLSGGIARCEDFVHAAINAGKS